MATLKAHGGKVASVTIALTGATRTTFTLCADGAILKAVQVATQHTDRSGWDTIEWDRKHYTLHTSKGRGTRRQLVAWRDSSLGRLRNAVLVSEEGLAPFELDAVLVPR